MPLNEPSSAAVQEYYSLLTEFMEGAVKVIDPTEADAVNQMIGSDAPGGFPWRRQAKQGHIYPLAFQRSDPASIISNRPNVDGVEMRPMQEHFESTLQYARQYASIVVDNDVSAVMEAGQLPGYLSMLMEDLVHAKTREDARVVYGDGTGVRAVVQATAAIGAGTLRLKRFDLAGERYAHRRGADYCWLNVPMAGYRAGVAITDPFIQVAHPRVAVAAGYDEIDITPGLSAELLEDDELVFEDDNVVTYGEEPGGLAIMHDDGAEFPIWRGVVRSAYPGWGPDSDTISTSAVAEIGAGHFRQFTTDLLWRQLRLAVPADRIGFLAMIQENPQSLPMLADRRRSQSRLFVHPID